MRPTIALAPLLLSLLAPACAASSSEDDTGSAGSAATENADYARAADAPDGMWSDVDNTITETQSFRVRAVAFYPGRTVTQTENRFLDFGGWTAIRSAIGNQVFTTASTTKDQEEGGVRKLEAKFTLRLNSTPLEIRVDVASEGGGVRSVVATNPVPVVTCLGASFACINTELVKAERMEIRAKIAPFRGGAVVDATMTAKAAVSLVESRVAPILGPNLPAVLKWSRGE